MRTRITTLFIMTAASVGVAALALGATSQPANNGEYALHADGGILYNPLSRDALKKGELEKFTAAPKKSGTLTLGNVTLKYEVPEAAEAYDVVPVTCVLESTDAGTNRPLAVECTAFEESARTGGRPLFDMSLPGDLSAKIEYVGHVAADAAASRPLLDPRKPDPVIKDYPGWKSDPLVRSGVIRKADYNWFTFRYTVTGNTIFDPEGFNGVQSQVDLFRKQPDGQYKSVASGINLWERNVNYQYPGESCEQTVMLPGARGALPPGDYKIRFSLLQKSYTHWTLFGNHWGGEPFAYLDVFLSVVDGKPASAEPKLEQVLRPTATSGNFPEYIHSFEEFMTGFEWHRNPVRKESSVIYVQVAPWTETITVKLIRGKPMELKAVAVPIKVSSRNVALRYNAGNPFVLERNGKKEPVIMAQLMPSMRHSVHFGHRPDLIVQDLLKDAQACGINVYCSESGGWALGDFFRRPEDHDAVAEATRYFNAILKSYGMPMVGHGIYNVQESYKFGPKLLYSPLKMPPLREFDSSHHGAPEWVTTWSAVALYHHKLWGDNWYRTADGRTIIDIEDSVGWMREGLQIRYNLGEKSIRAFQDWVQRKYGTIERVNQAWSSSFKTFAEINPEANQAASKPHGYKWEYYRKTDPVFYEWSPALADLDTFRSEARVASYREVLAILRKTIPGATFDLRTEGGNFIIPDSSRLGDTPHELHVKYSARRNAEIGEVLSKHADVIGFYSDYTPIPYTPDEWRKFTRLSVGKGIRPMPLPHLARARDMVLQQRWGEDYTVHYNLKHPARATMVFALQALFPVMQAVYEEGGCPGVIWADYLCDAFVTETQKKELKLLREAMKRMDVKERLTR